MSEAVAETSVAPAAGAEHPIIQIVGMHKWYGPSMC